MENPLKVVNLIDRLGVGGAEMMLWKLASRMNRERCRSVVISLLDGGELSGLLHAAGVPVWTAGMRRGRLPMRSLLRLIRRVRAEAPDILQTWMYTADFVGALVGRWLAVPVIWNVRRANPWAGAASLATRVAQRACKHLARWPAVVLANSRAGVAGHTRAGYRPRAWRVIPNGSTK